MNGNGISSNGHAVSGAAEEGAGNSNKRQKAAEAPVGLGLLRVASCSSIANGQEGERASEAAVLSAGQPEGPPDEESGAEALMALLSSRPSSAVQSEVGTTKLSETKKEAGDGASAKPRGSTTMIPADALKTGDGDDTTNRPKQQRKRKRKEKEEAAQLAEGEPLLHELPPDGSPWVNLNVTLRSGKYKGRRAVVLGLAKKKYRVQVEGLDYQLEFYPSYVGLPTPPEGYRCAPAAHSSPAPKTISDRDAVSHNSALMGSMGGSVVSPALVTVGGKQYMLVQSPAANPLTAKAGEHSSVWGAQSAQMRTTSPMGPHSMVAMVPGTSEQGAGHISQDALTSSATEGNAPQPVCVSAAEMVAVASFQANAHPAMIRVNSTLSASSLPTAAATKPRSLLSMQFQDKYCHWVGQSLQIQRGKYQGRHARILGLTSAKLQVMVPGVEHQLEYYPSMFLEMK